ncbi:class I SAM-dependent methyltransferase [Paenibacillus chondroitinus]|uniref:Class I SAM-dependent methyltransferase n=1 Tax=Paenibacillus chondroitinus TaxID=59842 RepID=A0ABU6D8R7_9BACL|nr:MULTISPECIES: class I SAM-dependent methyltransferase [Paenibacillus]MCY9659679.1 class I SAM-dependent methyltransferase [Paenibacillus anseongense]MEB4794142.1 class I SAM-dependent methyltransferase [Paenibacillus chondroitinus]
MNESALQFYDELAEDYHLLFEEWTRAVISQGETLNRIIRSKFTTSVTEEITLLDCSCGIGTQAIGLALNGFKVTATDLSPVSVERAKKEATSFGVELSGGVADFRTLDKDVSGMFHIVLSADNAIPHLLADEDLFKAASNMYNIVENNGIILITIRDYDELVKLKPKATEPRIFDQGKRIVFQIWDWEEDSATYLTNHFIMQEIDGVWKTKHNKTRYRALLREEFSRILTQAGFSSIEWLMPSETGYYQPIVTARKK